jgi:hypothetical protein
MHIHKIALTVAASLLLWSAPAMAQEKHVVDPSAMREAMTAQATTDQQNRDAVLGVLQQSQAREMAERLGLSLERAEGALSTLTSAELADLAVPARQANADLAGGANVIVISVTTLLLIIIIVILLVD